MSLAAHRRECVALVKDATGLGQTKDWKEGDKIKGPDDPPLQPGTALATFNKDGKYESNSTGNHAVIFLGYETRGDEPGMKVLEQWGNRPDRTGHAVREKFYPFSGKGGTSDAGSYSAIKPK